MIVVVGGVAALFVLGRSSRPGPAAEKPAAQKGAEDALSRAQSSATVLSEGFDYEQQVEGKPVFRLQGDRFTTDREGKVALDGVHLTLYREGEPYSVESRRADYDPATQDAQLEGNVRLSGGDGWEVRGPRIDLAGGGKVVVSRGPHVEFRRGEGLSGSARRLRFDLEERNLELKGDVVVAARSEDGPDRAMNLAAETVHWPADGRSFDAGGGVRLTSNGDDIRARRLEAALGEGGASIENATLRGSVTGTLRSAEQGSLDLESDRAEIAFADGSPSSVVLSTDTPKKLSRLVFASGDEPRRTLLAPSVSLELVDGKPSAASADGGVEMRERAPGGERRKVRARALDIRFDAAGELAVAHLRDEVVMESSDWTITGREATVEEGGKRTRIVGAPARARGPRGDLRAPELIIADAGTGLEATGGVHATFEPGQNALPQGDENERGRPIDVDAAAASFVDSPRSYSFRENVQAAQGDSLLFADELTGDESTLSATGSVRTLWTDRSAAEGNGQPVVTTITASRLDYRKEEGTALYAGSARARQERLDLFADEIRVELDAQQRARRLLASGQTRIVDRVSGRTVSGATADYDLATGQALVEGEPAEISERGGVTLRGRRALFDRDSGSARLVSEAP